MKRFLVFTLLFFLTSCSSDEPAPSGPDPAMIELGRILFFDTNLSSPPGQSCASCHDPTVGFADPDQGVATSEGVIAGRFGSRNSPTAAYAFLSPSFALVQDPMDTNVWFYQGGQFLDGRRNDLVAQAQDPFLNPDEMANEDKRSVVLAVYNSDYAPLFNQVFGEDALFNVDQAYVNIARAIAAFEASPEMNPFSSKFDYFQKGEVSLSLAEARGLDLFINKAKCAECHSVAQNLPDPSAPPSRFTNFRYFNIGVPKNMDNPFYTSASNPDGAAFVDLGLGAVLNDATRYGMFKVPTLRNVELTAPYMHNGVFTTLEQVVEFYNIPDTFPLAPELMANISNSIGPLELTLQEQADLVAFMKTLTDGYVP